MIVKNEYDNISSKELIGVDSILFVHYYLHTLKYDIVQ